MNLKQLNSSMSIINDDGIHHTNGYGQRCASPSWSENSGDESSDSSSSRSPSTNSSHSADISSTRRRSSINHNDNDNDDSDTSSSDRHKSSGKRGPGGRGGGGNNLSGVKGPRWNSERKALVLDRFLHPFVTKQLYRLDLQAALESFIIEQKWDDVPMRDMIIRIKRLLTNARDINKKKAARSGPTSSSTSSKANSTVANHKRADRANKVAAKAKIIKKAPSSRGEQATIMATPVNGVIVNDVKVLPSKPQIAIALPSTSSLSAHLPSLPPLCMTRPVNKMVCASSTSLPLTSSATPVANVSPWSPSSTSSISSSDSQSDVEESEDGNLLDGSLMVMSLSRHGSSVVDGVPSTPSALPSLSLTDDKCYDYSLGFAMPSESALPLPMLPSLPSLLHQQQSGIHGFPRPFPSLSSYASSTSSRSISTRSPRVRPSNVGARVAVISNIIHTTSDANDSVDAVDAAPIMDAVPLVASTSSSSQVSSPVVW